MITRRRVSLAGGVALVAPWSARAQPKDKVWRVGFIGIGAKGTTTSDGYVAVFLHALAESGFVEGRNMLFERRATQGQVDRVPAFMAEFIALNVDVIAVVTTGASLAAKSVTSKIPLVMLTVSDPVDNGLVNSLARPGGNITGIADLGEELIPKLLELLKAAAPNITRVAFIHEDYSGRMKAAKFDEFNKGLNASAKSLGIDLRDVLLNAPQDLERVTAEVVRERADALVLSGNSGVYAVRKEIYDFAILRGLPTISENRDGTGGALMSYGADVADIFRKGATYVAKILNGAKPADLPIERPTKFELIVYLQTAKAIGLTIPQSLLLRADEVIR